MICIAKPKLFCFFFYYYFNFISWLVYYPFVCALFVINWIKMDKDVSGLSFSPRSSNVVKIQAFDT